MQRKNTGADVASSVTIWSRLAISLPSDDLDVAQVGHQQQDERPPVLLVGDRRRRGQRGEEEHQGELEQDEQLEQQVPEAGDDAELGDLRQPISDCQAVHIRMNSRPTYEARAT